jgi:hypothetical protein
MINLAYSLYIVEYECVVETLLKKEAFFYFTFSYCLSASVKNTGDGSIAIIKANNNIYLMYDGLLHAKFVIFVLKV